MAWFINRNAKAVQDMDRLTGLFCNHDPIRFPHVAADEALAGRPFLSNLPEKLRQRPDGGSFSRTQQPFAFGADLADTRKALVSSLPKDFIGSDQANIRQVPASEPPLHCPLCRAEDFLPGCTEASGCFLP
jgi:hypothetical protein